MKDNKWFKSLFLAVILGVSFVVVIFLIYFLCYSEQMDNQLFTQFYLVVALIGMIAIILSFKRFGIIFYSGAIIGLLVNCVTTYMESERPTMAGGIYNLLITIVFFIVAVIFQIRYEVKRRRK